MASHHVYYLGSFLREYFDDEPYDFFPSQRTSAATCRGSTTCGRVAEKRTPWLYLTSARLHGATTLLNARKWAALEARRGEVWSVLARSASRAYKRDMLRGAVSGAGFAARLLSCICSREAGAVCFWRQRPMLRRSSLWRRWVWCHQAALRVWLGARVLLWRC